jgi:hypothetical protein
MLALVVGIVSSASSGSASAGFINGNFATGDLTERDPRTALDCARIRLLNGRLVLCVEPESASRKAAATRLLMLGDQAFALPPLR